MLAIAKKTSKNSDKWKLFTKQKSSRRNPSINKSKSHAGGYNSNYMIHRSETTFVTKLGAPSTLTLGISDLESKSNDSKDEMIAKAHTFVSPRDLAKAERKLDRTSLKTTSQSDEFKDSSTNDNNNINIKMNIHSSSNSSNSGSSKNKGKGTTLNAAIQNTSAESHLTSYAALKGGQHERNHSTSSVSNVSAVSSSSSSSDVNLVTSEESDSKDRFTVHDDLQVEKKKLRRKKTDKKLQMLNNLNNT